jgi:hypothetical protein
MKIISLLNTLIESGFYYLIFWCFIPVLPKRISSFILIVILQYFLASSWLYFAYPAVLADHSLISDPDKDTGLVISFFILLTLPASLAWLSNKKLKPSKMINEKYFFGSAIFALFVFSSFLMPVDFIKEYAFLDSPVEEFPTLKESKGSDSFKSVMLPKGGIIVHYPDFFKFNGESRFDSRLDDKESFSVWASGSLYRDNMVHDHYKQSSPKLAPQENIEKEISKLMIWNGFYSFYSKIHLPVLKKYIRVFHAFDNKKRRMIMLHHESYEQSDALFLKLISSLEL